MARPTLADRLRHILDAIADVEAFTAGRSLDDYLADTMRRRAVEWSLEIVSEASRHVPHEAKTRHSEIAWRGVADFGNILRHDYPNVRDPRVWDMVTNDLAPLKAAVETMLPSRAALNRWILVLSASKRLYHPFAPEHEWTVCNV